MVPLLLVFFGLMTQSAEANVYRGTIGPMLVTVELCNVNAKPIHHGRYFYDKHKQDIELDGPLEELIERDPLASTTGSWQIKSDGKELSGIWLSPDKAESMPIRLEKVGDSECARGEVHSERGAYDQLKLAGRDWKLGETPVDVGTQTVTDPHTNANFYRIVNHPSETQQERVNAYLEEIFLHYVLDFDGCDGRPSASVNFVSARIFDFTESGSISCGGAHPHNYARPKTIDLSTGKEMRWSDYIHGFVPNERKGEVMGPTLLMEFTEATKSAPNSIEPECEEYLADPTYLSLSIKNAGKLTLNIVSVPHAAGPCQGAYAEIPVDQLKQVVRKPGDELF